MSLNMSMLNPFSFYALKQKADILNDRSHVTGYGREVPQNFSDAVKVKEYTEYLTAKYGNVIIAPNILEEMARDPEKAAYYEGKIDSFFADIPRQTALFAAKGLDYQPCGVVVHEDGIVTYIGGCADSPERVAQVNAINRAKREKQAAQRKAAFERSEEAAIRIRKRMEQKAADELTHAEGGSFR